MTIYLPTILADESAEIEQTHPTYSPDHSLSSIFFKLHLNSKQAMAVNTKEAQNVFKEFTEPRIPEI